MRHCLSKLAYLLIASVISSALFASEQATQGSLPNKALCKKAIPLIPESNTKIRFAYTQKVKEGPLSDSINNTRNILNEMTRHLSPLAIEAINISSVVVYHCDPSLKSGLYNQKPYEIEKYDYLTLLSPKSVCEDFQSHPKTFDGRVTDQTIGSGIGYKRILRYPDGTFYCAMGIESDICDITTICDANLVSNKKVPHHDAYYNENILVHEFAHTIMNVGLPNGTLKEKELYSDISHAFKIYKITICPERPTAYACHNKDEMWAEASQAWFGATCRTDKQTNIGLTSAQAIKQNLPSLYRVLEAIYGPQYTISKIPVYGGGCD